MAIRRDAGGKKRRTSKASASKAGRSRPARGKSPISRGSSGGKKRKSMIVRGDKGRRLSEQESAKSSMKKSGGNLWRFWVPAGETKQFIILDEKPDVYMYEHNLKDPKTGNWSLNLGCVKETHNCPLCEEYEESYFGLFMTVIELLDEEDKYGNEFARRLMVVKPKQHKIFQRMYDRLSADGGSLRGALVETVRDTKKDPRIGNDVNYIETLEEEQLEEFVRYYEDRDGNEKEEDCSQPFDYDEIFPVVTVEQLRAYAGGGGDSIGSMEDAERELDGEYLDEGEDDRAYGDDESDEESEGRSRPRSKRRGAKASGSRRRTREEEVEEEEEEELDDEELDSDEIPFDTDEEEEELDDEEEKPARRSASRKSTKKKASRRVGRRR